MSTSKMIGVALVVAGAILLYFGFNAAGAPAEEISEALTGQYSDRTTMYFIAGGVSAVLGVVALLKK
jgi:uncharacterized membrane protein